MDAHSFRSIIHSIRRRDRLVMLIIIGVLIVVIAGMIVTPRIARSAPSKAAPVAMTGDAGKKILTQIKSAGWECYRSKLHQNWGYSHRCFKTKDHEHDEPAQAVMTLIFQGPVGKEPVLTSAGVEVIGSQSRDIRIDDAVGTMSKALGGDQRIEDFFHNTKAMDATTMPGDALVVAAPSSLQVVNTSGDILARQQNAFAAQLPEKNHLVSALEERDFECNFDYRIVCSKRIGDAGQVLISVGEGQVQINAAPSSSYKIAENKRAKIAKILAADSIGLTNSDGEEFLSSSPETGQRADFGDYAIHVLSGVEDEKTRFVFTISTLYDGSATSLATTGQRH